MAFKDLFTGSGQARAEKAARGITGQFYDDNIDTLKTGVANARKDFSAGTDQAIGTLTSTRDAGGNVLRGGGSQALDHLRQGLTGAQGALGQAREAYGRAGSAYDGLNSLSSKFAPGSDLLVDALGINGKDGLARAKGAFRNSLGNSFELEQGIETINRARAARGGGEIAGGNIDRDTLLFGQNYANSKTDGFLDRLYGLTDRQIGAEGAAAAGYSNAANAIGGTFGQEAGYRYGTGQNAAQTAQSTADRIAALTSGTGTQIAGLQAGLGTQLGNTTLNAAGQEIDLRQALGSHYAGSLRNQAEARTQGSARALDTGFKVADFITGLAKKASTAATGGAGSGG